jgi:hypothetical protein
MSTIVTITRNKTYCENDHRNEYYTNYELVILLTSTLNSKTNEFHFLYQTSPFLSELKKSLAHSLATYLMGALLLYHCHVLCICH